MFDHCAVARPQTVRTPRSQGDSHQNTQREREEKTTRLAFKHSLTDGRCKVLANNNQLCKNIYPYIIRGGGSNKNSLVIILGAQFPQASSK